MFHRNLSRRREIRWYWYWLLCPFAQLIPCHVVKTNLKEFIWLTWQNLKVLHQSHLLMICLVIQQFWELWGEKEDMPVMTTYWKSHKCHLKLVWSLKVIRPIPHGAQSIPRNDLNSKTIADKVNHSLLFH